MGTPYLPRNRVFGSLLSDRTHPDARGSRLGHIYMDSRRSLFARHALCFPLPLHDAFDELVADPHSVH